MSRKYPETYCKEKEDYVRTALAIETLAYHNKNYLWTGDNCKISEEVQALLSEFLNIYDYRTVKGND